MKPTEKEDASALRRLDELVAQGEALMEARRNPAKGGKAFPDFGEAYDLWNLGGKKEMILQRLCGILVV